MTAALTALRSLWPAMLEQGGSSSVARAPGGAPTMAEDDAYTDADIPRLERVLSLRRQVVDYLAGLADVVMRERPVPEPTVRCRHGAHVAITLRWPLVGPTRPVTTCKAGRPYVAGALHAVSHRDFGDLVDFLTVHVRWLTGHELGPTAAEVLATAAARARAVVDPPRRTSVRVGECPVRITPEGESTTVECGTPVYVKPGRKADVKCKGCGTTDTVDGWLVRITGRQRLVTAPELCKLLHRRLGLRVKPVGVRTWVHRGLIVAASKDDTGRDLFDFRDVALALMRREELREADSNSTPGP